MRDNIAYAEAETQTFTTWRNPTPHPMHVDIFESQGRPKKRYVFPPGKEVQVPTEHDRAIHDVRDGLIVGGLAPLLERVVADGILHPVLDPELVATKAAMDDAEKAVLATKAASEVLANVSRARPTGGRPPAAPTTS
jgi:hypothetical protein